jgi:hypothetical protein
VEKLLHISYLRLWNGLDHPVTLVRQVHGPSSQSKIGRVIYISWNYIYYTRRYYIYEIANHMKHPNVSFH